MFRGNDDKQVVYNNDVVVFGTPLLSLRVGDAPTYERRAVYSSGSGTSALVFEYIVEVGTHATVWRVRKARRKKFHSSARLVSPRRPRLFNTQ